MVEKEKPDWLKMKSSDVESLIVQLGQEGKSPSQIGIILRDAHGIPKVELITKKRIKEVLLENKIDVKSDKQMWTEKIDKLNKHLNTNRKDYTARIKLVKNTWIVNKLN
jgi:small subunit ribosomal protein S13e